jgi:hypothetical protein
MKDRDMSEGGRPQLSVTTATRLSDMGLFIELGQPGRAEIKRLKRGTGALVHQIEAALERWHEELGIHSGSDVVPVVLLYRRDEQDFGPSPDAQGVEIGEMCK